MAVSKSKSKIMRDHEREMALLNMFNGPNGFDLMLLAGAATGYGITYVTEILTKTMESVGQPVPGEPPTWQQQLEAAAQATPLGFLVKEGGISRIGEASSPLELFTGILNADVPKSFANLCIMLLIYRCVFGTAGMAEMLKGIGALIPFT